jgi:hypothetical protein
MHCPTDIFLSGNLLKSDRTEIITSAGDRHIDAHDIAKTYRESGSFPVPQTVTKQRLGKGQCMKPGLCATAQEKPDAWPGFCSSGVG